MFFWDTVYICYTYRKQAHFSLLCIKRISSFINDKKVKGKGRRTPWSIGRLLLSLSMPLTGTISLYTVDG